MDGCEALTKRREFDDKFKALGDIAWKAEQARTKYAENKIPGEGKGLFEEMRSAYSNLGENVLQFLDNGYELQGFNTYAVQKRLSTEHGYENQKSNAWYEHGFGEKDCPHCGWRLDESGGE